VVIDASRLGDPDYDVAQAVEEAANSTVEDTKMAVEETVSKQTGETNSEVAKDTPDVPVRFSEKKRLNWKGKSYLAPLTTVGNLVRVHFPKTSPFFLVLTLWEPHSLSVVSASNWALISPAVKVHHTHLSVQRLLIPLWLFTVGLATSFLAGSREEWSLVRRHPSESIFGVQVAGNKPQTLVPTAEVLAKEFSSTLDFVDLNCGCPIDLVFRAGSGSACASFSLHPYRSVARLTNVCLDVIEISSARCDRKAREDYSGHE
jgi:tRNA-dihydrouridine synthase 3